MEFAKLVKRYECLILIAFLILAFALELKVTFSSPIAFGDEGFHTRMSQYMAENKEYPLYNPIETTELFKRGFTRPPLWELLEGGFYLVFGFNETIVKVLTPFISSILTGLAVYILVKRIYDEKVGILSSIISVTLPAIVTYAVLFYVDTLFMFYFSMFAFLLMLGVKTENKKYMSLAGIFGAFAFLTKIVGIFIVLILALVFMYSLIKSRHDLKKIIKLYSLPLIVMSIFVLSFLFRSMVYYETPLCIGPFDTTNCDAIKYNPKYSFSQVTGRDKYAQITEQVGTNVPLFKFGATDYIVFAYGNIWFIGISFLGGLFLLWKKYENKALVGIILLSMLVLLLDRFDARTEDAARWLLGWSPIIATIAAIYLSELYSFLTKYQKYLGTVVILGVIFFGYSSLTEKLNVMQSVKKFSPLFFEACNWVKENLPQDVLISTVWGHHTTYNCQRTVAPNFADFQLSNDADYIVDVAKQHGITHIFIQKFSIRNYALEEGYTIDFVNLLESNSDKFKKIYENGPNLQQCLQQGGCDGSMIYEIDSTAL